MNFDKYFLIFCVLFYSCSVSKEVPGGARLGMLSVVQFGASPDAVGDDSEAFRRAMAKSNYIYVPEGVYKIRNIRLDARVRIVCESRNSIVEGLTAEDVLFISGKAIFLVSIEGGTWQNAGSIVRHTGRQAISTSVFRDMYIRGVRIPFDLSSSIGNSFQNIHFGDRSDICIRLGGEDGGQSNVNRIYDCNFLNFQTAGILFSKTIDAKIQNSIERCWFENSRGSGIILGDRIDQLSIRSTYFERVGSRENSDILIGTNMESICKNVYVEQCSFQNPNTDQSNRIVVNGRSELVARDNSATLRKEMVFAHFNNSNRNVQNLLENNYLNAVGGGDYRSRLFSNSANQRINWNTRIGSGFVKNNPKRQVEHGQNVSLLYQLDQTSQPSIAEGNNFWVSSGESIEDFIGGEEGVQITITARSHRVIRHSDRIRLLGSESVRLSKFDVIEFVYMNDIWIETSRNLK
ncbi:MAG: hypothetical protein OEQ53_00475 [Saprospiraceae bacterium]|nr:hypothetical protein [Saprospiraceae bacterium]